VAKSRVANAMLLDVPWDGNELASPLTLPGALLAPSYVEQATIAKPSNPAAGKLRLYPKSDGKYYTLDSAGVETQIGTAGATYTHPDPFTIGTITVTTKATLKTPDITGNMTFTPDNTYDVGASAATRPKTIWVGTSVDTPLVKAAAALALSGTQINLQTGGTTRWIVQTALLPNIDGASDIGSSASRVRNLYLYSYTEQRQINTPASPPAGSVRIYPKTDGKLYMLSSAGVEVEIGTGVGGAPAGPVPDPLILENGLFVNDLVMMEHLTFITVPGPRIRGDMYNATNSNRLMFESSATNQPTFLGIKPSGTGTASAIIVYSKDDTANSPYGILWNDSTQVIVGSSASGTGVSLPLSLWSDGQKWKIPVAGHLLAGANNSFDIGDAAGTNRPRTVYTGTSVVTPLVTTTSLTATTLTATTSLTTPLVTNTPILNVLAGSQLYLGITSVSSWEITGTELMPASDNLYTIGRSTTRRPANIHVSQGVNVPTVGPTLGGSTLNLRASNQTKWTIDNVGALSPVASDNFQDIGTATTRPRNIYVGTKILGDYSNATAASRVMFQTTTANSNTNVGVIASGTGTISSLQLYGGSDANNAAILQLYAYGAGNHVIEATKTGTGVYKPLQFNTSGTPRLVIETDGLVDAAGTIRTKGYTEPASGAGMELYYDGTSGAGGIQVLGRGPNDWKDLNFTAKAITLTNVGGVVTIPGTINVGTALSTPYLSYTNRIVSTVPITDTIAAQAGGTGPFEIGTTGGGAAFMAFHRHGAYAAHFGIDTDNNWRVGGWSMGAVSHRIITTNDLSVAASASSVVQRTPEGYINGSYINMTADVAAGVPVYVAGQAGDNYMRWWPRGVLVPTQQSYTHTLNCTANQAWNLCSINGALATTWLNNQSSYFLVKPGVFAIYGTVHGYYNTGFRIYTDGALRMEATVGSVSEFGGGVGGGWVGQVNSSIQFYARAGVSFSGTVVVTWVPVPGSMY